MPCWCLITASPIKRVCCQNWNNYWQDWNSWPVLGNQLGRGSSTCQHNNQFCFGLVSSPDSRWCKALQWAHWKWGWPNHLLKDSPIVKGWFCLYTNSSHYLHSNFWIGPSCTLTTKHHTVSAIKDSICYVSGFSASWPGRLDHGFKHLSSSDHRLAHKITLIYHHFLCQEDFLNWNLHSKITTSNHEWVSLTQDLIKIDYSLLILNLRKPQQLNNHHLTNTPQQPNNHRLINI